jgi:hypothetical protein
MSAGAHAVDCATASFNPNEVVSKIVELLLDASLSRFADGYYADDRGYSDGDPQDGKNASHLVPE